MRLLKALLMTLFVSLAIIGICGLCLVILVGIEYLFGIPENYSPLILLGICFLGMIGGFYYELRKG